MEDHFMQKNTRCSKRPLNINVTRSSSCYRKQARVLFEQNATNYNRSSSSSCNSLNSYLKQPNLTDKDFFELRQAFKTICCYLQSNLISNPKQHLASPYYRQKISHNSHLLLPLYTNEYFIQNGLLNHNDHFLDSKYFCHSHPSSSMIVLSPLELLSNQKHCFTALTSNFALVKSKSSTSNMDLKICKSHENQNETNSMLLRRKKVQIWERENILQEKMSVTTLSNDQSDSCCQSVLIRHVSSTDKQPSEELFPMVKTLAPYIIIPDSFRLQIINKKPVHYAHHSSNIIPLPMMTPQDQSLLLPSILTTSETYSDNNNNIKEYRKTKNYLLAEFESVLTQLSRK